MTNLLFPTDFSMNTSAPLAWARLFAFKTGATITLLHVYQPMLPDTTLPTATDPGLGMTASLELEDISRRHLTDLADQLHQEGLSVRADWRIGSVEDEIIQAAQDHSADLIVMGRSALNTFFDRLAGSSVTDVASAATCPVLVVPTPDDDATQAVLPVQVHTIGYAMQPKTNLSDVSIQTDSLVEAFGATLQVLTEDQLDHHTADLLVMELYPQGGFLDKLIHPNRTAALVEKSTVPVLVYHQPK
ncbi:hypothetical protein GCM10027578_25290 [Spirosoma luteolum]